MDRASVEKVIREAYGARRRGDLETTCVHFADDARFTVAGDVRASAIAGSATGCEAVRGALTGIMDALDWVDHEIVSLVIEGDQAAVHSRVTVRARATGEEVETEMLDLLTVRDGKIASFLQFCDTARAAQLLASAPPSG